MFVAFCLTLHAFCIGGFNYIARGQWRAQGPRGFYGFHWLGCQSS